MSDLFDQGRRVPLHLQLAEARRELDIRRRVYPRFVEQGMKQQTADDRLAAMAAIVETLRELHDTQTARLRAEGE